MQKSITPVSLVVTDQLPFQQFQEQQAIQPGDAELKGNAEALFVGIGAVLLETGEGS